MDCVAKLLGLITITLIVIYPTKGSATASALRSSGPLEAIDTPALAQRNAREADAIRLFQQGMEYFTHNRLAEAIAAWETALRILEDLDHRHGQALTLNNLGVAYIRLDQYELAIAALEQLLPLTIDLGDVAAEGRALGNLGVAHLKLSEYEAALGFIQQQLDLAQRLDDVTSEAIALGNLGLVYDQLGQSERAISFHQRVLAIAQAEGNRNWENTALGNLGIAYIDLEDYGRAIDFLEDAVAIGRDENDLSGQGTTLNNLGLAYEGVDDYERAIQLYEQALDLFVRVSDRSGESSTLGNLANVYRALEQYNRAINLYDQQLAIARDIGDRAGESRALYNQGLTHLLVEQFIQAEAVLEQAIDILDALRSPTLSDTDQISLFDTQQATFHLLQQVLAVQGKYGPALTIAERGRAQAFSALLMRQLNPDGAATSLPSVSLEAIQSLAQRQQITLLEYSLARVDEFIPTLYIWVVSPDGVIAFRQQPLSDIDLTALVTDTRDALGVGEYSRAGARPRTNPRDLARLREKADENLRQLHQILIDPIADLLPINPDANVAFIPQGELFLVPFPALKDANGDYLIENHTILTAPSIQVLQLTHDLADQSPSASTPLSQQGLSQRALIVGDPAMPTVTFLSEAGSFEAVRLQPLYGARQEAEAVGATLNASALLGDAATEARVKQQIASAALIHLATHGLLEYGDPRQTGSRDTPGAIALAPGNGEDGLLTSTEILQMELQADLVVLSACDTGRGRITGDGVIGLSRSFIAAGVPSVIVSLWAVPDAPTAELMTEFYNQLAQGQTKAQALRQAMLITMQTHPDPKNWAAFTLIGNAE
ncbi:MAG: CHAT domain-containing protein [Cyanobacteria bacterium]|nr:CHAT domain-containing protein [Cyanobacteriota bacterium]